MQDTQGTKLVRAAPGDDASIGSQHVVVVITILLAVGNLFFIQPFIRTSCILDDGGIKGGPKDVCL